MLLLLNDADSSIAAIRDALAVAKDSKNPSAISMVANSLGWVIRDTDPVEARRLLDDVIELQDLATDISLPLAHANRAVINAREGRRMEAVRDARAAVVRIGPAYELNNVLGSVAHLAIALAELGRYEAAATVYSSAQRVIPAAAHPAYGWHRVADRVTSALGPSEFEEAWTRGARMDRDVTVAIVVAEFDAVEAEEAEK